jgi:glutathione S-transferase
MRRVQRIKRIDETHTMSNDYILYGMPASLYTGKVRSFLNKQGIRFVERGVNDPHYQQTIVPLVGRMIMPVLECPDGTLVQDGADIIDYFEQQGLASLPAQPESSVLAAVSSLFELFGGEGMLRPAMHYRWNFDEQLDFIKSEFACALTPPGSSEADAEALFEFASGRMRGAASSFGVSEESASLIEASYLEFLELFAAHLKTQPYLLGDRPTRGDYGLIAPLFAHLGRDPVPMMLTRQKAPGVSRWVERMHAPGPVWVEHTPNKGELLNAEEIPDSLKSLMRYVSQEYLPELQAHVDFANQWLRSHESLETGTNGLDKPDARFIGLAEFDWRGIRLKTMVMPYRFYLLQKIQDGFAQANTQEQKAIEVLFAEVGLSSVLQMKTDRRVERKNHLEVWGEQGGE